MLFSLLKNHFDLNITDTALKVSRSLYCFTTSVSHGVENYFPRLWGTGISDVIFSQYFVLTFEVPVVKCHHRIQVNWSGYRGTSVTDPALTATAISMSHVHTPVMHLHF